MSFTGYDITTLEQAVVDEINNDSRFDSMETPASVEIDQLFQSPTALVKSCPTIFVEIVEENTEAQNVDSKGRVIWSKNNYDLRLYVASPVKKTAGGVLGITEMIKSATDLLVGNNLSISDIIGISINSSQQRVKARIKSTVADVFYLWQINMNIKLFRKAG